MFSPMPGQQHTTDSADVTLNEHIRGFPEHCADFFLHFVLKQRRVVETWPTYYTDLNVLRKKNHSFPIIVCWY